MFSRRSFLVPIGFVLFLPLSVGCVVAGADSGWLTERDEKHFTVEGKPDVVLSTFDGSIEIRSWDRPDVLVVVEKRAASQSAAAAIDVVIGQQGNHISVEVKPFRGHRFAWWLGGGSARLIVSVPQSADVRAASGDGAIDLDHVNGTIALRSGDGRIHATNSSGSVSAATGDGAIELDRVDGAIEATTGDGRVTVAGKLTSVRARSGDGRIAVHAEPGSTTAADWDITSGDGAVTLQLPDGFSADLDASTGDGSIRIDGVSVASTGPTSKHSVSGRLGAGGRSLRVRTGDGSITLRRP